MAGSRGCRPDSQVRQSPDRPDLGVLMMIIDDVGVDDDDDDDKIFENKNNAPELMAVFLDEQRAQAA